MSNIKNQLSTALTDRGKDIPKIALFLGAVILFIADTGLRLSGNSFNIVHPIVLAYALMAILATAILKEKNERIRDRLFVYSGMSLIAYCVPFLNLLVKIPFPEIFGISIKILIGTLVLIGPLLWIAYFTFAETTRLTSIIGLIIIMIWASGTIMQFWGPISQQVQAAEIPGVMPGLTIKIVVDKVIQTGYQVKTGAQKVPATIGKNIKEQIYYAQTGIDPQQAKTEASAKGPKLTIASSPQEKFYADRPVSISATLDADIKDILVEMTLTCAADNDKIKGTVYPRTEYTIQVPTIEEIACQFETGQLAKGPHDIAIKSNFNYESYGYIESFFMPQEIITARKRNNMDPLDGVAQPVPESSDGPLNIKIKPPESPIPGTEQGFITTITIHNAWPGKINKIKSIYIYVPKGLKISSDQDYLYEPLACNMLPAEEAKTCDSNRVNAYQVKQEEFEREEYRNITLARMFTIHTEVEDADLLLGNSEIKPGSFHTSIKYDYELEQAISVTVY